MSDKGEGNRGPRFGGLFFYLIMLVILVVFSTIVFGGNYGKKEQAKLSDVLSYIDNKSNEVELVEVKGTVVTVRYKNEQGQPAEISQSIPYEYVDDLIAKLQDAKANGKIKDYNYTEPFDWSIILNIGSLVMAAIIIIVLFINISRQSREGSSVFSFGNNRARVSDPNKIKVKFSDVAGSVEEKEELSEIVDFLKSPKKYQQLGAKIPKGVLLYGAPGTGKTLLARAVAGEAGVKFFYISGSDFVEMLVGVGASRVRSLFADAKREAPSVVFIDEIDAVGRKRGAGLGGGQDEREQTLNQILVEMDGFDVNSNIIVMAATNRVDVLDPALLRPGRFDRRIMVNMPDADEREAILKIHAKNKPLAKDVSLREVALSTVGFTGADLENLLNEAALMTARHNKKEITMLEVTDAMFRVQMGPQKNSKKLSDKVKKLTSYHEAGHAVVLRATSEFEKVDRVTIIPAGQAGGYTAYKPIEDTDYYTEKMLLDTIKMSLGGRAAEEIFLGEVSTGAASDLRHCNDIAKNMIKRYGLSKKFRNMVFGDENEEVFLGYSMGQVQSYSEQTAAAIDAEIKAIIDDCYAETKRILIEKQAIVEGLAQRLITKLTVEGPDFEKIYVNNGDLAKVYPKEYATAVEPTLTDESSLAVESSVEAAPAAQEPQAEPAKAEETPSWPAEAANLDHDSQNDPGPTD
ncbi:MAG: ATP-dependent zinc metalloprotease FtsH [Clostridiales bacterium]|nr:ATP-dependent zinc metalloprotease FtsH [Clostridiales bacterium]